MSLNLDPKESPGWCAIDSRLASAYPGANAVHFANPILQVLGGADPLNAVSAYYISGSDIVFANKKTSKPEKSIHIEPHKPGDSNRFQHWHFVTYGFSELFSKSPDNSAESSGYGFELSFRIAPSEIPKETIQSSMSDFTSSPETLPPSRRAKSKESKDTSVTNDIASSQIANKLTVPASSSPNISDCPVWAVEFLQTLARYVFSTGTKFDVGHYMGLNGILQEDEQGANNVTAIVFAEDPVLGTISTPNGRVKFLQVVGITTDELELIWESDGTYLTQLLTKSNPLLLTRLSRASILTISTLMAEAQQHIEAHGSSLSSLYNAQFGWSLIQDGSKLQISLGANVVKQFSALLKRRLPYGRCFTCVGTSPSSSCGIIVAPASDENGEPEAPLPAAKRAKKAAAKKQSSHSSWKLSGDALGVISVKLSASDVTEIVKSLRPTQGAYKVGNIEFVVSPTLIKDPTTSSPIKIVGE